MEHSLKMKMMIKIELLRLNTGDFIRSCAVSMARICDAVSALHFPDIQVPSPELYSLSSMEYYRILNTCGVM